jgi:hypothetical protein|eukprot:COSAG01_NODE_1705_length_9434_cov_9.025281_2_plen_54_part_00
MRLEHPSRGPATSSGSEGLGLRRGAHGATGAFCLYNMTMMDLTASSGMIAVSY